MLHARLITVFRVFGLEDSFPSQSQGTKGAIHSTKISTGPTGKRGPPQKVDPFFRNFSGWTEPIHWVLDRNFRKFWLNGSRPSLHSLHSFVQTLWEKITKIKNYVFTLSSGTISLMGRRFNTSLFSGGVNIVWLIKNEEYSPQMQTLIKYWSNRNSSFEKTGFHQAVCVTKFDQSECVISRVIFALGKSRSFSEVYMWRNFRFIPSLCW